MGSKKETQVQTTEPPAWQVPYIQEGLGGAQQWYRQGPQDFYPFQTYAGFNPLQLESQAGIENYARNLDAPLRSMMAAQQYFGPESLSPDTNPYLSQYAEAAIRPIEQSLTENILPALRGSAISAGQYGGSRQALAEGLATGRAAQAMGDVTSNIYNQAYQTNVNNMLRGLALAPQTLATGMLPQQLIGGVGGQQQAMDQLGITEAMQRYYYPRESQLQNLQNYLGLVGGGQYGAVQSTPYYTNPLMSGLGGAATGAGLGMMFGVPALGAGIGLLGGFL